MHMRAHTCTRSCAHTWIHAPTHRTHMHAHIRTCDTLMHACTRTRAHMDAHIYAGARTPMRANLHGSSHRSIPRRRGFLLFSLFPFTVVKNHSKPQKLLFSEAQTGGRSHPGAPGRDSTLQGSAILENHEPWPLRATDFQSGFTAVGGDSLPGLRRQVALIVQKDVIYLTGGTTLALKKTCSLSGSPLDVGLTLRGQRMSEMLSIRSTSPKIG